MSTVKPLASLFQWASRNRIFFSTMLGICFLFISSPEKWSLAAGIPFILIGETIRFWSSGIITKNTRLTREGPYSLSRNPLYVGNFFLGLGFVCAAGIWWILPVYLLLFWQLYKHTIQNEEEFLRERFPNEWALYYREVHRFFPLTRWPDYRSGTFDWSLVMKHREQRNILVILIIYAILGTKYFM